MDNMFGGAIITILIGLLGVATKTYYTLLSWYKDYIKELQAKIANDEEYRCKYPNGRDQCNGPAKPS